MTGEGGQVKEPMKEDTAGHTSGTDTKHDILKATVELIRDEGIECATLRRIATKADTNLALVNYHFGSKEKLITQAIRSLVLTFEDVFNALEDDTMPARERLKQFFYRYVCHLQEYPGLVRQMIDQTRVIFESQHEYSHYCKVMKTRRLIGTVREITGEEDDDNIRKMLMQLYGAIFFPVIMKSFLAEGDEDMATTIHIAPLEEQIDTLFEHYFHQYS